MKELYKRKQRDKIKAVPIGYLNCLPITIGTLDKTTITSALYHGQ